MCDIRQDDNTVFIFNARDYKRFFVMKEYFNLSDDCIYNTINEEFSALKHTLQSKGIAYAGLKGALLPCQEANKMEICFVFDTEQIESNSYGNFVFSKLLPLLDKHIVCSIMCGDYVDILANHNPNSQRILKQDMNEVVKRCNKSAYVHSSQYYLVYLSRLTKNQFLNIVEKLLPFPWFTGFADVTHISLFKTNLSAILTNTFIKCKDTVILPHPADCSDDENVNTYGYAFEQNAFKVVSVNNDIFNTFLSYKIESLIPDENDVRFSFNALFPEFTGIDKLNLEIADNKWSGYLTSDSGKGRLLELLGYTESDKEKFKREIYKNICSGYIYKLERKTIDGKNIWKFCVCIDMLTVNGSRRKTTVVLNYFPHKGEMHVITVT